MLIDKNMKITGGTKVVTENFSFNVSAPIVSQKSWDPAHAFVICLFDEGAEANLKNPHGISSIAGFFVSGYSDFYVIGLDYRGEPSESDLTSIYEEIELKIYEEVIQPHDPENF